MKSYWGVLLSIVVFALLMGLGVMFGQDPKPAASSSAASSPAPAVDPAGKVSLTPDESKELEYNRLESENLDFKVKELRERIMEAKQKLAKENADLEAKYFKAHNLTKEKYSLDQPNKVFLPRPPAATPEKKPADGK